MASSEAPSRLPLTPVKDWPATLRAGWMGIMSPAKALFAPASKSCDWTPATLRHAEQGIGKLVSFVRAANPAAAACDMSIADLVQQEVLGGFTAHLQVEVLAANTQASYLNGIWLAARALAPKHDWAWIGYGLTRTRANARRPSLVNATTVSTDQLFLLGKQLFADAVGSTRSRDVVQAQMARDGLIIALLALRPLRRKNLTGLTIGKSLLLEAENIRIAIPACEMKMGKHPYDALWPEQLVAELDCYLNRFRPVLLGRYTHEARRPPAGDALWVSERGTALDDSGIYKQVAKLTKAAFGQPVNLHRFRNSAASTIAVQRPDLIHLVTPLLGHHDPRSREFYIEADQLAATSRSHASEDRFLEAEDTRPTRSRNHRTCRPAPERPHPDAGSTCDAGGRSHILSDLASLLETGRTC